MARNSSLVFSGFAHHTERVLAAIQRLAATMGVKVQHDTRPRLPLIWEAGSELRSTAVTYAKEIGRGFDYAEGAVGHDLSLTPFGILTLSCGFQTAPLPTFLFPLIEVPATI